MKESPRPLLHGVMERAAKHLVPFQVSIEVTHRCNQSCKHCFIDVSEDELTLDEIKNILDQLLDAGTLYLLLTGGEPLMREDFVDIAFYAREHGFLILMLTNGTLVTPDIAKNLKKLEPVNIGISIHGADSYTHDSITRQKGSFDATIKAVRLLKDQGINVSLQTLLMDSNVHHAEAMVKMAGELGVVLTSRYELVPARSGSLAPYQYMADSERLYSSYKSNLMAFDEDICESSGVCKAGQGICAITAGGDVYPCLLMPLKIGNLRQSRFDEIWRTNPCKELKYLRSITDNDLVNCRHCKLAKYCQRCLGRNYTETGKLTDPAPSACRNADLKAEFLKRKGVVT